MPIALMGVNHTTAPVAVRERLAFSDTALSDALTRFRTPDVEELVILSTCNRVEFYMQGRDAEACIASCEQFVADYHELKAEDFAPCLYRLYELDAVRHLFRVAASLDSMVLGEPQILGQVKSAYYAARDGGRTGTVFHYLFERAFNVGKAARSETGISDHAVSVSFAAVQLAKKIFEDLQQRTVMVLGAGDTSELAARHFVRQGVSEVFVANRTMERAQKLAQSLSAKAIHWEEFPEHLAYADIVVSSTSAPGVIITPGMVQGVIRRRRGRAMFFIDIAVPRDIDPAVNGLENVFLYDIDGLENVVAANRREREQEALAAEDLVWREVRQFRQWLATRDVVPTIVALRRHAENTRLSELEKALARLGPIEERQRRVIEALTVAITNKFLHPPTVRLKRCASAGEAHDEAQLIRDLFDLDPAP